MLKLERNNLRTTATETMTWDKESRMLTNSLANASYAYNGFDARVSKTVGANTTTFKRAGADPVSPVLSDVLGGTTTRYLPGISSNVGGTSTFNHSGIKNGILQTNSSQSNTATKRYDAFGDNPTATGTWQTRFDYGGPFGYQRDDESDYKLLGHRYYDPEIGRFLTRDPIKDGRNWFSYVSSSPLSKMDANGLSEVIVYWYPVAGIDDIIGHHTGIAVIDNMKPGKPVKWSFAGGPEVYGNNPFKWGKLVSRSRPWSEATQDFDKTDGNWKIGIKLVDDDSNYRKWMRKFSIAEIDMYLSNSNVGYDPLAPPFKLPLMPWAANSNSYARDLLDRTGLRPTYEHGRRKRGGSPWAPGWGSDPWEDR
jgi:RHS repeat-associated protein